MEVIDKKSSLWSYLTVEIQGLIVDGETLLTHAGEHKSKISDFSYLVFPFAKAYEGFLKRLFLDVGLIREDEYYGDDIRIGRILNPYFIKEHGNIFEKLCSVAHDGSTVHSGKETAEIMWHAWKRGRNRVFHYFPHNFRSLSYIESKEIIDVLVHAMETGVGSCQL